MVGYVASPCPCLAKSWRSMNVWFFACVLVGQVGMDFLAFRTEANYLTFTSKVSIFPLSRLGKGYVETRRNLRSS